MKKVFYNMNMSPINIRDWNIPTFPEDFSYPLEKYNDDEVYYHTQCPKIVV